MTNCVLAYPVKTGWQAAAGEYQGPCGIEEIIYNKDFVEWDGAAMRHFIPVNYYKQFMKVDDETYAETYGKYDCFVFLENDIDVAPSYSIMIDHTMTVEGEWICFMWKDGKIVGFPTAQHAQTFFYWLTSKPVQQAIYDKQQTTGTKIIRGTATRLI